VGGAALTALVAADRQTARYEVNLLPIVVNKRRSRVDARSKAEEPRAPSALGDLIQRTREDFLLDAGRITGQRLPADAQIELMELFVFFVDGHERSPILRRSVEAPLATAR
jgi:hypothetical protein